MSHFTILYKPTAPMNTSQTMTTGAKINPILCVPKCCNVKRHTSIAHAKGTGTSEVKIKNKSNKLPDNLKMTKFSAVSSSIRELCS